MEIDETTQRHLKRFTTDAIVSEIQKKDLKRHKLIEWSHGFWHLTVTGRELAEQLGFLAQREGRVSATDPSKSCVPPEEVMSEASASVCSSLPAWQSSDSTER